MHRSCFPPLPIRLCGLFLALAALPGYGQKIRGPQPVGGSGGDVVDLLLAPGAGRVLFRAEGDQLGTVEVSESADLLVAMNEKLNERIDSEVGEDVGQMLPGDDASWKLDPEVAKLRM